jgi:hypothetical protein
MTSSVGENHTKRKLRADELVLFMGVNQMRTPNIAMIAASCGFDGVYIDLEHNPTSLETAAGIGMRYLTGGSDVGYILSAGRADVRRIRDVPLA